MPKPAPRGQPPASPAVCLDTPEAKRRELAQVVEALLAADAAGEPTYYLIGGDVAPATGLDCSGLVVWAALQAGLDLMRLGIRVTDEMFRKLERIKLEDAGPGDLVLYGSGREPDPGTHVVVILGPGPDKGGLRVASMSGGGAWCTSLELAKARRPVAKLKEFASQHYRTQLVGYYRLPFAGTAAEPGSVTITLGTPLPSTDYPLSPAADGEVCHGQCGSTGGPHVHGGPAGEVVS